MAPYLNHHRWLIIVIVVTFFLLWIPKIAGFHMVCLWASPLTTYLVKGNFTRVGFVCLVSSIPFLSNSFQLAAIITKCLIHLSIRQKLIWATGQTYLFTKLSYIISKTIHHCYILSRLFTQFVIQFLSETGHCYFS